jgi:hypothetical protein
VDTCKQNIVSTVVRWSVRHDATDANDIPDSRVSIHVHFPTWGQQCHGDQVVRLQRIAEHFAVARLEYVKGLDHVREEDEVWQWKKPNQAIEIVRQSGILPMSHTHRAPLVSSLATQGSAGLLDSEATDFVVSIDSELLQVV